MCFDDSCQHLIEFYDVESQFLQQGQAFTKEVTLLYVHALEPADNKSFFMKIQQVLDPIFLSKVQLV